MTQHRIEESLRARLTEPIGGLDVDLIMTGEDFAGAVPEDVFWQAFGAPVVHFNWKRSGEQRRNFRFNALTGALDEDPAAEFRPPIRESSFVGSLDGHRWAYVEDGDLWFLESGVTRRLTKTADMESDPIFSADGRRLYFENDGEVFAIDLDGGGFEQVTTLKSGSDPEEKKELEAATTKPVDRMAFLAAEERALLRLVDEEIVRGDLKKVREERQRTEPKRRRFTPKDKAISGLSIETGGRATAVVVSPKSSTRAADMPRYVTQDGYAALQPTRPKVGDRSGAAELHIVDVATGVGKAVDFGFADRAIDLRVVLSLPAGGGFIGFLETIDNKTAVLFQVDLDAKATILERVDDAAWVYHFGESYGFLPGGEVFWYIAERHGFRRLVRLDLKNHESRVLTAGAFEVRAASFHQGLGRFLVHTSEVSAHETHVELLHPESGAKERLTFEKGVHQVSLSNDGEWMADVFGKSFTPSELFVRKTRGVADSTIGLKVTDSPSLAFKSRQFARPEIVRFAARDGTLVPMRLYRPSLPKDHRPAVIFVHGAGYLQNVHEGWSRYFREYLFHNLLVERGYFVIDVDYRGSAGYGRDWRTANYRHMGSLDLTDQVDAARWLVKECGVDPKSIGIYGGSYGGFITLMALFTEPTVFRSGAALRPVTDWAHYNHGYTSNILNVPHQDPEAYRRSSPIWFAEGLVGDLLICHGVVDDNVHFQDSVRLVQRLIELRKENWEIAIYPMEPHGFVDSAAWADEYKRILRLFERTLSAPGVPQER